MSVEFIQNSNQLNDSTSIGSNQYKETSKENENKYMGANLSKVNRPFIRRGGIICKVVLEKP